MKELINKFKAYNTNKDQIELVEKAYKYAVIHHKDQKRKSGEDYITHCISVADILMDYKMDAKTIAASLLHDTVEDTSATLKDIEKKFGAEIAHMVEGVTKIGNFKFTSQDHQTSENLRKMLVSTAKDIRILLIKLADRTHNMRTLSHLPGGKQQIISQETLMVYSPIAQRLGMFKLKNELEDLAFKFLHPLEYNQITKNFKQAKEEKEILLEEFKNEIDGYLKDSKITYTILARIKNKYSIFRKMKKHEVGFDKIEDGLGIRIITNTISECYGILAVINEKFKTVEGNFTDYIATPKINLYQSLHTTIETKSGHKIEVQIRTQNMHNTCEHGIASHWRYKTGVKDSFHLDEKLNWIRQWLQWMQDITAPQEFLEVFQTDINLEQVFVSTPKGDIKALPKGSTVLDFAYSIHTDIGKRYVGAKVDDKIVKMSYELLDGQKCEVLTKKSASPKQDWLHFAKTPKARSEIKRFLKHESDK